jgi:hypothetical protein
MIWGVEDSTVLGLAGIIAGLVTALVSFWWNYKTRALSHREFLYQKQFEEYLELSTIVQRLLRPCYSFLMGKRELTPENRVQLLKIIDKLTDDLRQEMHHCETILPMDVVHAINELIGKSVVHVPKLNNARQIGETLLHAEWDVYKAIRKNAGVEPLTEDMLQAFGEHT